MCSNAPFLTFVSHSQFTGYHYQPDCQRWTCPECRPQLEASWDFHARAMFLTCDTIGYLCVRKDQLRATLKQLHQDGSQYIRIRGHGIFHFYTTQTTRHSLSYEQAVESFSEHISLAPAGQGHVISTSRAWKKYHRPTDPLQKSDAILVAIGVSGETVKDILANMQRPVETHGGTLSFDLETPQNVLDFAAAVKAANRLAGNFPHSPRKTERNSSGLVDEAAESVFREDEMWFRDPAVFEPWAA